MELTSIAPKEIAFQLKHPGTGEDTGIFFMLVSLNDPRVKKVQQSVQNRIIDMRKRGKMPNATELEETAMQLLEACITGWDWSQSEFKLNGATNPEYNRENVRTAIKMDWVKAQLDGQLKVEEDFFTS